MPIRSRPLDETYPPPPPPEPEPEPAAAPGPAAVPPPEPTPAPEAQPGQDAAAEPDAAEPDAAEPDVAAGTEAPLGLRAQLGALRRAVERLIRAHIELARTEIGEILDEVKRVAGLVAGACGCIVLLLLFLPIGLILFLGEWIFGSIGWGLLHGTLGLPAIAVGLVLIALRVRTQRLVVALGFAVIAGVGLGWLAGLALDARPAAAIGLAAALLVWPLLSAYLAYRDGLDAEALQARFIPSVTIETTKETIEWLRERTPLGPKS